MNVNELVQKISEGNEEAFRKLFEHSRDRLHVFVLKMVKKREVAEEIVLDVFTRLWQRKDIVNEVRDIENFLFKAASNRAIDFLRAANKDKVLKDVIWEEIQIADAINPADVMTTKKLQEKVEQLIGALPPQRQLIFQLSRDEGLSYEQIASRLDISKNTVRNQMIEALKFIRAQLHTNYELFLLLLLLKKN
ncbi:MAG: RNA polymerase sigma-70 factor [Niabella sp.]